MIVVNRANDWTHAPAGGPQPGLTLLLGHLIAAYGGSSNGIYVDRPMRGSSNPSLHRDGRALDWLQPDDYLRAQGAAFCEANAESLQVQEIHRYKESLAWNPSEGWHHATGEAFGAAWANWIHVERNLVGSADTRPISEIIHVPAPPIIEEPEMEYWKTSQGVYLVGAGDPIPVTGAERDDYAAQRKAKGLTPVSTLIVPDRWVKIANAG